MSVISGKCGDNLTWHFDKETGTITIKGFGKMYDYANQLGNPAPWEAVQNLIKYVVISEGVSSIGDRAFADCDNLASVVIINPQTKIKDHTFPENTEIIRKEGECKPIGRLTLKDYVPSLQFVFEEFDMEQLSNVNTFAMDMNASFNRPVEKYMPKNRDCL